MFAENFTTDELQKWKEGNDVVDADVLQGCMGIEKKLQGCFDKETNPFCQK